MTYPSKGLARFASVLSWIRTAGIGAGAMALVIVAGLILSGECSAWRARRGVKGLPVAPGHVEAGRPVPTEPDLPPIALVSVPCDELTVPDLSPEELVRRAAKYGLILAPAGRAVIENSPQVREKNDNSPTASPATSPTFPLLLAEERFGPGPAGDSLDVAAWLGTDNLTDLRAKWADYQPPPPSRERFFSLRPTWGLGILGGTGEGGRRFRGYGLFEPLRIGRVVIRGEAGVEGRASETGWYAMAGGEIRFN
ncbi:MAG: hypothetical protein A2Y38_13320 [Spirochaetes bacterium GWB1_59_5]|nr:MAG: hypothetical protein A2Y38_13320 [Spirochaetes bacterium GWB1_59_5]